MRHLCCKVSRLGIAFAASCFASERVSKLLPACVTVFNCFHVQWSTHSTIVTNMLSFIVNSRAYMRYTQGCINVALHDVDCQDKKGKLP